MYTLVMLMHLVGAGYSTVVVPGFDTPGACELAALSIIHKFDLNWIDQGKPNSARYACVSIKEGKA